MTKNRDMGVKLTQALNISNVIETQVFVYPIPEIITQNFVDMRDIIMEVEAYLFGTERERSVKNG